MRWPLYEYVINHEHNKHRLHNSHINHKLLHPTIKFEHSSIRMPLVRCALLLDFAVSEINHQYRTDRTHERILPPKHRRTRPRLCDQNRVLIPESPPRSGRGSRRGRLRRLFSSTRTRNEYHQASVGFGAAHCFE